jgi:hypothetical protein
LILSDTGNVAIPPPAQKTFDAEGEALEHALMKTFRIRNEAIKSLAADLIDVRKRRVCSASFATARAGLRLSGEATAPR